MQLMLMGEKQKIRGAIDPHKELLASRRYFNLNALMTLFNFTLLGDRFTHYCPGVTCCRRGADEFKEKVSYHMVSIANEGTTNWMPTRFTQIFGTPSDISSLQCINFFGATAFTIAFKKKVEETPETIKTAKDVPNDPLADINWTTDCIPRCLDNSPNRKNKL